MLSSTPDFWNRLLQQIESHDVITLFRHQYPDSDALGSQLGLKHWIENRWKDKKVLALGSGKDMDQAEDDEIRKSLAVITDTSNAARVDDERWKLADASVRIDHHVKVEQFTDLDYVDDGAAASCEIIARLLSQAGESIPADSAQRLYEGLIADCINYSISSTTPETMRAGAWLLEQKANVILAKQDCFDASYEDFLYENRVRSKACRQDNFLYSIMEPADYLLCAQTFSSAKEKVYALSGIRGMEVWALFTRMEDGVHYSASLRSVTMEVRDIAVRFGGGGHVCASGIKNLTTAQVQEIIGLCTRRAAGELPSLSITEA